VKVRFLFYFFLLVDFVFLAGFLAFAGAGTGTEAETAATSGV
jgi:hypothetical protein